ncbi:classical arabinogalactan protein 9-like [Cryptomeria japonica]|uniref:classical arabinogalactan protein 9-like n=1 Tax=Cryptomeria japonica TaxID=3369 RepID=UPI0027DA2919|nr:classical arabinogalactan protein 9-like [Cryptomeria japonica]
MCRLQVHDGFRATVSTPAPVAARRPRWPLQPSGHQDPSGHTTADSSPTLHDPDPDPAVAPSPALRQPPPQAPATTPPPALRQPPLQAPATMPPPGSDSVAGASRQPHRSSYRRRLPPVPSLQPSLTTLIGPSADFQPPPASFSATANRASMPATSPTPACHVTSRSSHLPR